VEVEGEIFIQHFTLANNKNSKANVLKLLKNIYGLKQAGRVLNLDLLKG